jgi:ABC-type bacteriocin/lantibiotic exporter with double-glycine peptidase domain
MKDIFTIIENFRWVLKMLNNRIKFLMAIALTMILISSFITSLIPKLIGNTIDNILIDKSLAYTSVATIGLLCILDIISEVIRKYIIESTATQTQKNLIVYASKHLIMLDLSWLNEQRSGGLNGKIQRSVEGAITLLKLVSMDFLPNIFQMIFAVIIAFLTNVYIGGILLFVIFLGLFIVIRQIHSQKGIRLSLLKAREDNDANIVELLTGIESVRVANEEERQITRIDSINENLRKVEMKHHCYMMFFDSLKKTNIVLWNIAILLLGILLVSLGSASPGDVVTFNLLFNNIVVPLQNIHRFIDEAHESSLKTSDLRNILNIPIDESYRTNNTGNSINKVDINAITITDLNFRYKEDNILNNINLEFERGKYYGIIGPTGCGKSTLLKCIMNLTHHNSGNIYLFGKEIKQISRKELSEYIIFMPQAPFIFNGTIRENILFGNRFETSDDELWESLNKSCLGKDINGFDGKLDFIINERGTNLSGGQRQRIALARVFLSIMKTQGDCIIILDEATSALDVTTEKVIMDNLLSSISPKTTIIAIAHRYSTLEKTDSIISMQAGYVHSTTTYNKMSSNL